MNDSPCEQVRQLAPEVALDIATGEERDTVLSHVASCGECRRLVFELSSIGDGLLTALAPALEPSPGFDSRVLGTLAELSATPISQPAPRKPRLCLAALAAAAVIAAVLGAGVMYQATSTDRELGEAYRATLAVGRGSSFAAAPITAAERRVGTVFAYQGDPSWLMVTLDTPPDVSRTYTVQAAIRENGYLDLGEAVFEKGDRTWGESLRVDLSDLQGIQFLNPDGSVAFRAAVDAVDPWN